MPRRKEKRPFYVHGREYLLTKKELRDEVPASDVEATWKAMKIMKKFEKLKL